ncbi:MAG: hypothetical protein ACRDM9_00670, partial [Gaiellaceae bacterium]
ISFAAFIALVGASAFVRTRALDSTYWLDEGISIGFASHGLVDIPGALEQDGSPPLYYLLLALWTRLLGFGEEATQGLSLAFALLTVPTGFFAGRGASSAPGPAGHAQLSRPSILSSRSTPRKPACTRSSCC